MDQQQGNSVYNLFVFTIKWQFNILRIEKEIASL